MIEEIKAIEHDNFKKEKQELQTKINILKAKLKTSYEILDKEIIEELENEISSIEDKLKTHWFNTSLHLEMLEEINKLEDLIKKLIEYYTVIDKIRYIDRNIKENIQNITEEKILELIRIMTESLYYLKGNEYFQLESQSEKRDLAYKTTYELIKTEILINRKSLLIDVVKQDKNISSQINWQIQKELKNITSSSFANPAAIKNIERLISQIEISNPAGLINHEIIKSILAMTKSKELKESYTKKYKSELDEVIKQQDEIATIIKTDIREAIKEKKSKIKELKKTSKFLKKYIIATLIVFCMPMPTNLREYNVYKNSIKYNTEIITYSLPSEKLEETTKQLGLLEGGINYTSKTGIEYGFIRTLETCGDFYYDEIGNIMYDYTIYDISDLEYTEDYRTYYLNKEKLEDSRIIESGTKEGMPTYDSQVIEQKQNQSKKINLYPEENKILGAFLDLILFIIIISNLILFILKVRDKKQSKEAILKVKELKMECEELINKNEIQLEEVKKISEELKTLMKEELKGEELLFEIYKDYEEKDRELRLSLNKLSD